MLNTTMADFYERDIRKLIEEVNLFTNEDNLWKTQGSAKNAAGNLVLHITGGLNYLIGATLAHTGYVRNRDQEFTRKDVQRNELIVQLEQLIPVIKNTLNGFTPGQFDAPFPFPFDNASRPNSYVLLQLLLHLNYHLGQVNYLRRVLEKDASTA